MYVKINANFLKLKVYQLIYIIYMTQTFTHDQRLQVIGKYSTQNMKTIK